MNDIVCTCRGSYGAHVPNLHVFLHWMKCRTMNVDQLRMIWTSRPQYANPAVGIWTKIKKSWKHGKKYDRHDMTLCAKKIKQQSSSKCEIGRRVHFIGACEHGGKLKCELTWVEGMEIINLSPTTKKGVVILNESVMNTHSEQWCCDVLCSHHAVLARKIFFKDCEEGVAVRKILMKSYTQKILYRHEH